MRSECEHERDTSLYTMRQGSDVRERSGPRVVSNGALPQWVRFGVGRRDQGFTLIEVLVSVAIAGVTLMALYSGFATCLLLDRHNENSTRAVSIMRDRLDLLRLYPWSKITNTSFSGGTFTNYLSEPAGGTASGTRFTGSITLSNGPSGLNYSDRMRHAVITVRWTANGAEHSRQMRTIVSDCGLVTMQ